MENVEPVLAVGLMSGTSMDGVDAALVETDGEGHVRRLAFHHAPYDQGFRARLRATLGGAGDVPAVAEELTDLHAEAVQALLVGAGVRPGDVALVGFHGQTILHRPERRLTWQIGDPERLAVRVGIDVVFDLRLADVAAGGQGAPLVPIFHRALVAGMAGPVAVLNIGGVANVTWIDSDPEAGPESLVAFDTGPGNALIDDHISRTTGAAFDSGGALAAAGKADPARLDGLLRDPHFAAPPPKSLDRDHFAAIARRAIEGLSAADAAALLTEFTAAAVARAVDRLPRPPRRWIVCGGGRRNATLMAALSRRLEAEIVDADTLGWDGDSIEAEAFAYLAVRSAKGLPISFPGTTGVPRPLTGGRVVKA